MKPDKQLDSIKKWKQAMQEREQRFAAQYNDVVNGQSDADTQEKGQQTASPQDFTDNVNLALQNLDMQHKEDLNHVLTGDATQSKLSDQQQSIQTDAQQAAVTQQQKMASWQQSSAAQQQQTKARIEQQTNSMRASVQGMQQQTAQNQSVMNAQTAQRRQKSAQKQAAFMQKVEADRIKRENARARAKAEKERIARIEAAAGLEQAVEDDIIREMWQVGQGGITVTPTLPEDEAERAKLIVSAMENNEEKYIEEFGVEAYIINLAYYQIGQTAFVFGDEFCDEMGNLTELKDEYFTTAKEQGSQAFFDEWNPTLKSVYDQAEEAIKLYVKIQEADLLIPVTAFGDNTDLLKEFEYVDSDLGRMRKKLGLLPKALQERIKSGTAIPKSFFEQENADDLLLLYNPENADDLLNMQLGLLPEKYDYQCHPEDDRRKAEGELPLAAEQALDNIVEEREITGIKNDILSGSSENLNKILTDIIAESSIVYGNIKYREEEDVAYSKQNVDDLNEEFKKETGYTFEEVFGFSIYEFSTPTRSKWEVDTSLALSEKNLKQDYGEIRSDLDFESEEEFTELVLDMSNYELYVSSEENEQNITNEVKGYIGGAQTGNSEELERIGVVFQDYYGIPATAENMAAVLNRVYGYSDTEAMQNNNEQLTADLAFLDAAGEALFDYRAENKAYGDEWYFNQSMEIIRKPYANELVKNILPQEYSHENYESLMKHVDPTEILGIDGGMKEFEEIWTGTLNFNTLNVIKTDQFGVQTYTNKTLYANDETMQNIKQQLTGLGWKGETQSDNVQINSLLEQAQYRTMQLMRDTQLAHEEFVESLPSWMVAIANGVESGFTNIIDGIESVVLEVVKLPVSLFGSTEGIDEAIYQNAIESQNAQWLNRHEVEIAQGASDFTMGLYEFTTVATEVGIMILAGNAIGAALGGTASTALTGWKSVASKLILQPQALPSFASSLGRNLIEAELDGKEGIQKWGYALPAAYVEGVLDQSLGLLSGSGHKLFSEGAKKLSVQTLKNAGMLVAENVLWEGLVQENLQDIASMFIKDVAYGNELVWFGEGGYIDPARMGKTVQIAGSVGLFFTLLGLPADFKSHTHGTRANAHLDTAVKALESGNMHRSRTEMKAFAQELKKGGEHFNIEAGQGKIDAMLGNQNLTSDRYTAELAELKAATAEQVAQRQAVENGQSVDAWHIESVKERISNTMTKLRNGAGIVTEQVQNIINPNANRYAIATAGANMNAGINTPQHIRTIGGNQLFDTSQKQTKAVSANTQSSKNTIGSQPNTQSRDNTIGSQPNTQSRDNTIGSQPNTQSSDNTLGSQPNTQSNTTKPNSEQTKQTLGDAYMSLLDLSETALPKAQFDTLQQTYRDFEANASPQNINKLADAAAKSIDAAMKSGQLTKQQRAALEGMRGQIAENVGVDSTTDNSNVDNGVVELEKNENITYYRVQGGEGNNASQFRMSIDSNGDILIAKKDKNLSLSTGTKEHANYFLEKRGSHSEIVEIYVPRWFDEMVKEYAIPQTDYKSNLLNQSGTAPKIVDPTKPGQAYEFPEPWVEWFEEYGVSK